MPCFAEGTWAKQDRLFKAKHLVRAQAAGLAGSCVKVNTCSWCLCVQPLACNHASQGLTRIDGSEPLTWHSVLDSAVHADGGLLSDMSVCIAQGYLLATDLCFQSYLHHARAFKPLLPAFSHLFAALMKQAACGSVPV